MELLENAKSRQRKRRAASDDPNPRNHADIAESTDNGDIPGSTISSSGYSHKKPAAPRPRQSQDSPGNQQSGGYYNYAHDDDADAVELHLADAEVDAE